MGLSVVILAAGNGKRMQTDKPKVLHELAGEPMLQWVVKTAHTLDANIFVIYGFGGEQVKQTLAHLPVTWVLQEQRLGTGHAVLQALPHIPSDDQVLILVGDSPLISATTLRKLLQAVGGGVGLVTTEVNDPTGLGRIIHDQTGKVFGIVEHKDATPEQRKIKDINSGIITAPAAKLKQWLPALKNNNAQGEYYLTDIIAIAVAEGYDVRAVSAQSSEEVLGVNDRSQLAILERHYQLQRAQAFMLSGVSILDPNRFDVRGNVQIEKDVIIDINVILEGEVIIKTGAKIGANCIIKNSMIDEHVEILPNSIIDGAVIQASCLIGPFARIRPQTKIGAYSKIGNFVEVKNLQMGEHSKANHLAYVGDAIVGNNVNIGAGTITCNYDGANKHQTIIQDGAFIGSDTQLIAPVVIGKNATIAAGSSITKDAPENQLTIARAKQLSIPSWQRPQKKSPANSA